MMKKVLTVVGARPQFIKAAAVSRLLREQSYVTEILVHTGQHFDPEMSDIFFKEMMIPKPDYNLGISGKLHGEMTGRMLSGIEILIESEKPDCVIVYGDTNSTLAGALAAVKLHVPVAHVEAGLRSHNMLMPEEVNRVLTDRLSQILFCPTENAVHNLAAEGFDRFKVKIENVGDVMQDVAIHFCNQGRRPDGLARIEKNNFILATIHRAENTDSFERLSGITEGLNRLNAKHPVILPLHPRTRVALNQFGLNLQVNVISPVGYLEMIWLLSHCQCVLTDSGGLQKEAYFFSKPCITVRDETEWTELIDAGVNTLAAPEPDMILQSFRKMKGKGVQHVTGLYGGGNASERIVKTIVNTIG